MRATLLNKITSILHLPSKLYHDWLVKISLRLLRDLDLNMIKAHYPRHKRRQFWRDFLKASKHEKAVENVLGKSIKKRKPGEVKNVSR